MVLAAGRGERMRPLTDDCPKPLLPVAGQPLIGHHLRALARAGITDVVVNHAWLGERIEAELGDGSRYGVTLHYSREQSALETGGGITAALPLLGNGPFLVINGDVWTDLPLESLPLTAFPWAPEQRAHLVLVPNPPQHAAGDFGLDDGWVTPSGPESWTYSGIGLYHPLLFSRCETRPFPLGPLLKEAVAAGQVTGTVHHGDWRDIGTPERLAALREDLGEPRAVD